jgi:hypothetical protein
MKQDNYTVIFFDDTEDSKIRDLLQTPSVHTFKLQKQENSETVDIQYIKILKSDKTTLVANIFTEPAWDYHTAIAGEIIVLYDASQHIMPLTARRQKIIDCLSLNVDDLYDSEYRNSKFSQYVLVPNTIPYRFQDYIASKPDISSAIAKQPITKVNAHPLIQEEEASSKYVKQPDKIIGPTSYIVPGLFAAVGLIIGAFLLPSLPFIGGFTIFTAIVGPVLYVNSIKKDSQNHEHQP